MLERKSTAVRTLLAGSALVATATWATGCVDAKKRFDEYDDRVGTTDASDIDSREGLIADITGSFLFATDPGFVPGNDPASQVLFFVTWTLVRNGNGATLDGTYVPLRADNHHLTNTTITASQGNVALDGTFTQNVDGSLPAESNPITMTTVPLMGITMGTILSADTVCGNLAGTVNGINLQGSTFAAIRVTDNNPNNFPTPITTCPSTQPTDAAVR